MKINVEMSDNSDDMSGNQGSVHLENGHLTDESDGRSSSPSSYLDSGKVH